MRKKWLYVLAMALSVSFYYQCVWAQKASSDKEIFETKLAVLLTVISAPDGADAQRGLASDALLAFASEYPQSVFVSDAQIVPNLILAMGAVSQGRKDQAALYSNKLEKIASQYPDGTLQDLTCAKWRQIFGAQSSGVIFIPYTYLPAYVRANVGMYTQDLKFAIDNLLLLKEKVDLRKDPSGMLAYEIYTPLLVAYKTSGENAQFNKVAAEATKKFSDNVELMLAVKKLTAAPKSAK